MRKLKNICKRHKINIEQAQRAIVKQYELDNLYKKSELVEIELEFKGENYDILRERAKQLRISVDALVCAILEEQINASRST